jgi:hypothetical protein
MGITADILADWDAALADQADESASKHSEGGIVDSVVVAKVALARLPKYGTVVPKPLAVREAAHEASLVGPDVRAHGEGLVGPVDEYVPE